jgi:hypothetical protein
MCPEDKWDAHLSHHMSEQAVQPTTVANDHVEPIAGKQRA